MKIGFFVNDVMTEQTGYTTIRLAVAATNRSHEAWFIGATDFAYDADEKIRAWARAVSKPKYKTSEAYLKDLQGKRGVRERITVDDLDILLLRSDPSTETGYRAWAQTAGINFGRVAMRHGVVVLNDPHGLLKALNKMYFQLFPEEVRPRTLISQNRDDIKAFIDDESGKAVLKPLQGSGGTGVFLVRPELVQDGTFLVGLDIVGDKLMEINVFSPGGLGSAQKFEKVNFSHAVIESLERKVTYMGYYRRNFDNVEMAAF